jgi:hypothetical protein
VQNTENTKENVERHVGTHLKKGIFSAPSSGLERFLFFYIGTVQKMAKIRFAFDVDTHGCGDCAFWRSQDEETGTCHRYPPKVLEDGDLQGVFPKTWVGDTCGEGIHKNGVKV